MINIQDKINDAKKKLAEKYNYSNPNQVPKIEKVVLHRGLGEALTNSAVLEKTYELFYAISGQKPIFTKAKNPFLTLNLEKDKLLDVKLLYDLKKCITF